MSLVGKKVRVSFDTRHWPVASGIYRYDGFDGQGYHLTRGDGVQRYFETALITEIVVVADTAEGDEGDEGEF